MAEIIPIKGEIVNPLYKGILFNERKYTNRGKSIILLGCSGAGKAKPGDVTVERFGLENHLESGDIFRNIAKKLTPEEIDYLKNIGKKLGKEELESMRDNHTEILYWIDEKGIGQNLRDKINDERKTIAIFQSSNGLYVNDEIYMPLAEEELVKYKGTQNLFDGYLRTPEQVPWFLGISEKYGFDVGGILLVEAPVDLIAGRTVGRLKCPDCKRGYNTTAEEGHILRPDNMFERNGLTWGYCVDDLVELTRRDDDYPKPVNQRISEFERNANRMLINLGDILKYIVSGTLEYRDEVFGQAIKNTFECNNDAVLRELK